MKTELLIETNPNIRAYPQYAFLDAIINNQNTNADKLCSIFVCNNASFNWEYKNLNSKVDVSDGMISIYRNGYGIQTNGKFHCECKEFQEIIFHIPYMQYTNVWDGITFFCKTDKAIAGYEFSVYCCGDWRLDVNGKNVYYQNNKYESEIPKWFRVQRDNNIIRLSCSLDGIHWTVLNNATALDMPTNKIFIGFDVRLCENQYYKWLCNNFIQIKFNKKGGKPIDYAGFINRDWKNYSVHPLVKFSYDKNKMIKTRGLWNYIVENISNGRYMEIWLDEYYVEGTTAYQKHSFVHESLIYGFDDQTNKVKLMPFKAGKPTLTEVPINILEQAWEKANGLNHIINTFEFCPDGNGYSIDLEHIYKSLEFYLQGKNPLADIKYTAQSEEGVFGKKIYKEILEDSENRKLFLGDRRIAYLMKEHKKCMLFRIIYLHEYGVLAEKQYLCLAEQMRNIEKKATIIMNLVIKNSMVSTEKAQESIWKYMKELDSMEEKCYQNLINELGRYLQLK